MSLKNYKLEFTESAKNDLKNFKMYILKQFKYKKYGDNFDLKMQGAYKFIKTINNHIKPLKIKYRGYDVYFLSYKTYLFFYIVDDEQRIITIFRVMQEGMNWTSILFNWISYNHNI